jgi:peptidoglycan hydrolase-like protein with peptidoglycan-binding domain
MYTHTEYYGQAPVDPPAYGTPEMNDNPGYRPFYEKWQRFLARHGGQLGSGCVDGIWGPDTRGAIQAFQRANGLPVSPEGYALASTLVKANELGIESDAMNQPLTAEERAQACGSTSTYTPPVTAGGGDPPTSRGPLGDAAAKIITLENVGITLGVMVGLWGLSLALKPAPAPARF